SGLAIRRNHNAVRHVANANLLTLYRRLCGQVNLGQRVVRVQHDISSLVIRRDRNPGGVRGALRNGNAAGNGRAARGSWRAVGEAFDGVQKIYRTEPWDVNEGGVNRNVDVSIIREQACRRVHAGDGNVAAVLAEEQVLAVRRVGDAEVAAVRVRSAEAVALQDGAGHGVEH